MALLPWGHLDLLRERSIVHRGEAATAGEPGLL